MSPTDTTMTNRPNSALTRKLQLGLLLWLSGSCAFARSGILLRLPPLMLPALIWTPVILGVLAYRRSAEFKAVIDALELRTLLLVHLLRIIFGASFLWLGAHGELPRSFAYPAGLGDLLAGMSALVLILLGPKRVGVKVLLAWNILGMLDMISVFLNAQRVLFFDGGIEALWRFGQWPFGMLPTSIVSLVLLSHLAIGRACLRRWRARHRP